MSGTGVFQFKLIRVQAPQDTSTEIPKAGSVTGYKHIVEQIITHAQRNGARELAVTSFPRATTGSLALCYIKLDKGKGSQFRRYAGS